MRTDAYKNLISAMDMLSEPPEVKFNAVSHTGGMEIIEMARGYKRHLIK
jgi:hypothetical protein